MANHYFQMYCKDRTNVFAVPIRCTTAQAAKISRQIKNPKIELNDIYEQDVWLPPFNEGINDRETILLEQVEAYFAVTEIKEFKRKNAPLPKKFIVDEATIKRAYKDCGAKLNNFRDAQTLIGLVLASSDKVKDYNGLQQLIIIKTTAVNSGVTL